MEASAEKRTDRKCSDGAAVAYFYFNEDKTGRLIVIDGRQRLSAIFEFLNNGFSLDNLKILDEFNKNKAFQVTIRNHRQRSGSG